MPAEPEPAAPEPAMIADALVSNLADMAREQLLAIADDGKAALAGNIDAAADMVRDMGDRLQGNALAPLAPVLADGASWLGGLADDISRRDVVDLVAEGRALVQQQPALAAAAAGVAGLVLGRLIRNLAAMRAR